MLELRGSLLQTATEGLVREETGNQCSPSKKPDLHPNRTIYDLVTSCIVSVVFRSHKNKLSRVDLPSSCGMSVTGQGKRYGKWA